MNQHGRDRLVVNPTLSEAELRACIYFAVGVTSESGNKAYMLAVAGDRASTARLEPADNSGYSIGTIQTDLGQHYQPDNPRGENVPRDLVDAYQQWAVRDWPAGILGEDEVRQTISDLGRTGRQIKAENGRALDAAVKSNIDAFLSSEDGISWVHERDVAQVNKLMRDVMPVLQRSQIYQGSSMDEQVRLAVVVSKVFNQNEIASRPLLEGLRSNSYQDLNDISDAVGRISGRTDDYFETGRDRALLGAIVVNALRNTDPENPLRASWDLVLENPLVNPAQLNQQQDGERLAHAYQVVRNLFVEYDQAVHFISALDVGQTYAYGRMSREDASRFSSSGLYAAGNDIVVWNASGKGDAYVGGVWQSIDREHLVKTIGARGIIDIGLNTPASCSQLLHVDPNAPALRPAPVQANSFPKDNHQLLEYGSRMSVEEYPRTTGEPSRDPLHVQAEEAVCRLNAQSGRGYDEHSACMAASVACLAKASGLSHIDHIVLSEARGGVEKSGNLFVVQGGLSDPAHHRAHMKMQDAIDMPVERSLAQLQAYSDMQRQPVSMAIGDPERALAPQVRME